MTRPNRNSHLFYSDVTEPRIKAADKDDNERESKLRYTNSYKPDEAKIFNHTVGLIPNRDVLNISWRYSRLIEEINEDQLDDQMDDEGSGSDSENSADGEHGDNIINNNDHGDQISFEEDDGEHKQLKHIICIFHITHFRW